MNKTEQMSYVEMSAQQNEMTLDSAELKAPKDK